MRVDGRSLDQLRKLKIIPDTMGITWERHPSVDLDTTISKSYFQKMHSVSY